MEISSKIKEEQNEKIQVYAPIKFTTDYSESKKYLNLFSKRLSIKYPSDIRYSIYNSNDLSIIKEKELNYYKRESDLFLIYKGIEQAVVGHRLGDISSAIQSHCENHGYGVVREFVGHGIGKEMHEDPQVPNFGKRGNGILLKNGLCIAIEPMITLGSKEVYMQSDKWGIVTRDSKVAAHFEHTICVRKGQADILSSFKEIEEIIKEESF
jgi:methionine aminopeptidase type I